MSANNMKFQRAVEPGQYYLIEATHLMKVRQDAKAEAVVLEGLEAFPHNPQLWHTLGKLLKFSPTQDDRTLNAFGNAYRIDPTDKFIAMDYAGFLTRKSIFEPAEAIYGRLFVEEGKYTPLLSAIGNHYQKRGMIDMAAAAFGGGMAANGGDEICYRRYMEVVSDHGVCFRNEDWQILEDRLKMAAHRPVIRPAPALQP
jgi:predicted Zn-dependent protease